MGGTNVLQALQSVYETPLTGEGWFRQIIFLTDGEVCNQDEVCALASIVPPPPIDFKQFAFIFQVIGLVRRKQLTARLFAIGLGNEVSTSLLWGVARAGRGTATFIREK